MQTWNFARRLKVRDRILNKKCKTSQNGAWPRSRPTFRSRDILNLQATEALINGKIRESKALDLQHGYQMWTWFVNFLDQKKQKLISTRNTFCGTWYLPYSHVHNERTVPIMAGCMAHARNGCISISTSGLKSDVTVVFLDPDFLCNAQISAICVHLRQM